MLYRNLCFKQYYDDKPIIFHDKEVMRLCFENYDTTHNGYITQHELQTVKSIPESLFKNNSNIVSLKDLKFFTNITTIYAFAFSNCKNCTDITFPKNIQYIYTWIIMNSPNIRNVIFLGIIPPTIVNNFMRYNTNYSIPKNLKIYVPDNAVQAYKEKWKSLVGNYINEILPLILPMSEYSEEI